MNVGQEYLPDPILDQIDQMEAELVLILERVGIKAQDFAIVGYQNRRDASKALEKIAFSPEPQW